MNLVQEGAAREVYGGIKSIPIVDVHTHVDYRRPYARNAWDILKYHYFTEMAHSQHADFIEPAADDAEIATNLGRVAAHLEGMAATEPYMWLMHLAKKGFDFPSDVMNVYEFDGLVRKAAQNPERLQEICSSSNIKTVCLTNQPWDDLTGVAAPRNPDGSRLFIPTYRVDALLYPDSDTISRMEKASGVDIGNSMDDYLGAIWQRADYMCSEGAASLAASLGRRPEASEISEKDACEAFHTCREPGIKNDLNAKIVFREYMLCKLAEVADGLHVPFQLMVGVRRGAYAHGVPDGCDVSDPMTSISGLNYLFNRYPGVDFPLSILSPTSMQELAEYARIFPNVRASGHWWFGNTNARIENELAIRLSVAPHTKLLGQYSDAYTMEFIDPKMEMYRQSLANVLGRWVENKRLSVEQAVEIGRALLYDNPKGLFRI